MRIRTLTVIALTGVGLSGCSLWTKSDKADTTAISETNLRSTPQQDYQFADQLYDVEIFDTASQYAGYDIELYDPAAYYYYGYNDTGLRPLVVADASDPKDASFVKLNGPSQAADWQNCEMRHRGYLFMSESEMRLNPEFEVCMRNKGYVLSAEYGPSSKTALNAQTASLRGGFRQSSVTSTYSSFYR